MNSRERVRLALNHKEPDRIPFDLGGTVLTSMHHNVTAIALCWAAARRTEIMDVFQGWRSTTTSRNCGNGRHQRGAALVSHLQDRMNTNRHAGLRFLHDEFGIGWQTKAAGCTMTCSTMAKGAITKKMIDNYPGPTRRSGAVHRAGGACEGGRGKRPGGHLGRAVQASWDHGLTRFCLILPTSPATKNDRLPMTGD